MATLEPEHTKSSLWAAAHALDQAIEQAAEQTASSVSGTTFVPAHLADTERVREFRRLGPVTIVDAEGNETRLAQDRMRDFLAVAVAVGLVVWIARSA